MKTNLSTLLRRHSRELRFMLLFFLYFAVGLWLYNVTYDFTSRVIVDILNAGLSARIINAFTPGEQVVAQGAALVSEGIVLNIRKGCEGIEGILLLCSAMLAFSAPTGKKIRGILIGVTGLYTVNLARTVSLYYIYKYIPAYFNFFHVFVGQTIVIFIGLILFVLWTSDARRIHERG